MKKTVHFHAVFDPERMLFALTTSIIETETSTILKSDETHLTETQFYDFIKNLKDPIVIGAATVTIGDEKRLQAYKEYLLQVLRSYYQWLRRN